MMNIIPVRIPNLFSQVTASPRSIYERGGDGSSPFALPPSPQHPGTRPSPPRPLRLFMRMAMLVAGLAMLAGPGRALAQKPLGIDVSSYQGGGINWTSVKGAGIAFAWTKATEGTGYIDADFTINENNGKAAGVYVPGAGHLQQAELRARLGGLVDDLLGQEQAGALASQLPMTA